MEVEQLDFNLLRQAATYQEMFDEGILPPMVVVSFSSGRISYYHGTWEAFVTDELPWWASRNVLVIMQICWIL